MDHYYHNIDPVNIENGNGIRCVVWLSGCTHHCDECFNKETWEFDSGVKIDDDFYEEVREALSKDYCSGLTITGGDPMATLNVEVTAKLVKIAKDEFHKSVWIWTGFTMYTLYILACTTNDDIKYILENIDVLVDGTFKSEFACKEYHWAGSINQDVIDVKKTLENIDYDLNKFKACNKDERIIYLEPEYTVEFRKKYLESKNKGLYQNDSNDGMTLCDI